MSVWLSERSKHGGCDRIAVDAPGTLWLSGKHFVAPDPFAVRESLDLSLIVCLCQRHELNDRYPSYVDLLDEQQQFTHWYPIPDLSTRSDEEMVMLVEYLTKRLHAGERMLVHCGAGIGRAGTVAAAIAIATGSSLPQALATVASSRPMAGPESGAQMEFIERFAARFGVGFGVER